MRIPVQLRRKGRLTLLLAVTLVAGAIAAVAYADNVKNDVVAGGNDTITAGGSTTIDYWIQATQSDGCDAADGSSATVTISAPAGVTATPSSRTFSACNTSGNEANPNNTQSITFSSSTAGDYPITVSVSDSAGNYNTSPASFTLHVQGAAAPDADGDGVPDSTDNCPSDANPAQEDVDSDGLGDACDENSYAPAVETEALDANGVEGSAMSTSGAFSDQDGTSDLTITKLSGAGTVTPSPSNDGTWSWSHTAADDDSGTVVVQASDGEHAAVTDSFDWTAANVPPAFVSGSPAFASSSVSCSAAGNVSLNYSFTDPGADT
jgi:hypothetical protein